MNTAITTTSDLNLAPGEVFQSWSHFSREYGAASKVGEKLPVGTYLEIQDRKFLGDHLILLRKTDFERLIKCSRTTSQIKRVLFSIEKTAISVPSGADPTRVIEAVREIASLGVELVRSTPTFPSVREYLHQVVQDRDEEGVQTDRKQEVTFPKTRSELRNGVHKKG